MTAETTASNINTTCTTNPTTTKVVNIGTKAKQRLDQLTENSSRESVATLARWMAFHRKFRVSFCNALRKCCASTDDLKRVLIYLSVAHEAILLPSSMNEEEEEDEEMKQFQMDLIQFVFVPVITSIELSEEIKDTLCEMISKWKDTSNEEQFSPMIQQLLQLITNTPTATNDGTPQEGAFSPTNDPQPEIPVKIEDSIIEDELPSMQVEPAVNEESNDLITTTPSQHKKQRLQSDVKDEPLVTVKKEDEEKLSLITDVVTATTKTNTATSISDPIVAPSSVEASSSTSATDAFVSVDFEKEGIPLREVKAEEILIPFRSIATSQIAREVRHDAIERISTIVQNIPKDSTDNFRDEFLDLNLKEALHTMKTYRDAIQHQCEMRKKCVHLLIESRCQFGSAEAAKEFLLWKDNLEKLSQLKLQLQDAMELEGCLDFETSTTSKEADDEEENPMDKLEPLVWFTECKKEE